MFLPLGQAGAGASAGYPAVEAGGPPPPAPRVVHRAVPRAKPAPVVHIRKERPIVRHRPHRHHRHWDNIEVDVFNRNHNLNRDHRRHRQHHDHINHEHHFHHDFDHDFKHDNKFHEPVRDTEPENTNNWDQY
jgi:hypothetical protein